MKRLAALLATVGVVSGMVSAQTRGARTVPGVGDRIMTVTRTSAWRLVRSIPVGFRTFHPQGMVKLGNMFYVSSVEVSAPTERLTPPQGAVDRTPGAGIGRIFQFDDAGKLVATARIGDGSAYHPGGMDYDGRNLWVPVAEYRPDSRSVIYRVNPATLEATEVLRVADHIGAVAYNSTDRTLHGVSWGSRRFYRWRTGPTGLVLNPGAPLASIRTVNPSHYIDYQDCHYVGGRRMLCGGVADYRQKPEGASFRLGGLDLVNLTDGRPVHQVPVPVVAPSGRPMTQNPFWAEASDTGLRVWFMPDDDTSTLFEYEVTAP